MALLIIPALVTIIVLLWLTLEYSILIFPKKGVPILMYHKISETNADELSLPVGAFEKQLEYLRDKGYHTMSFAELSHLQEKKGKIPPRTVILTFDDAYADFFQLAQPALEKFTLKATVFIPVGYIGRSNEWDQGSDPVMSEEQISKLGMKDTIEFGLHSYLHKNYGRLSLGEMKEDLMACFETLKKLNIPFVKVLAYPYGGFPGRTLH